MTTAQQVADPRLTRMVKFIREHGPIDRVRIMHWCGFPSPKEHPVTAYVEFENALIRLNRRLASRGLTIEGGWQTNEIYKLVELPR